MKLAYQEHEDLVKLSYFNSENFKSNYMAIHELIQESYKNNYLFFFNFSNQEVSIFFNNKLNNITNNMTNISIHNDNYRILELHYISNKDGIEDIGIVNIITSILSKNNISILYINSFNNNYILLKENDYSNALEILIKQDIIY
jgi:hypothetical protein